MRADLRRPTPGRVPGVLNRRDRLALFGGLAAVAAICWLYLLDMAADMDAMPAMSGAMTMPPGFGWLFVMWSVMMAAMMLPSALPMIHAYARFAAAGPVEGRVATAWFAAAYLIVWTGFSVAAATLQMLLVKGLLLSPMMALSDGALSGAVLIAAGVYQWTAAKQACLHRCRAPIGFLMTEWRDGARGALVMGLRHGGFCVGCCWALMALLFVGGVMDILWIMALTGVVLVEKVVPRGDIFAKVLGLALIAAGAWVLIA